MEYKVIELNTNAADPSVELRFSVASERMDGVELLRVDLPVSEDKKEHARLLSTVTKILKQMKEERLIQFFANAKSFDNASMEAEFLINKYPSIFLCGPTDNPAADFFYIKI